MKKSEAIQYGLIVYVVFKWLVRSVIFSAIMLGGLYLIVDLGELAKVSAWKIIFAFVIFVIAGEVYQTLTKILNFKRFDKA